MSSDSFIYSFTNASRPNHCLNLTKIGLKPSYTVFNNYDAFGLNLTKIGLKLEYSPVCVSCPFAV